MGKHPTDEELNAFLAAGLPPAERKGVLLHLSRKCPECRRRLTRLSVRALGRGLAAVPPPASAYDGAIDRAFATVRRQERSLAREREAGWDLAALLATAAGEAPLSARRPGGWALIEELLARSYELRYRDPAGMVRLAELARLAVLQLR